MLFRSFGAASLDMAVRAFKLWRTSMAVFVLFGVMIVVACHTELWGNETERLGWTYFVEHPVRGLLAGMTTFYQPDYMDILPVFMWSMLALPAFAWLEQRIGAWALALPIGLYAVAQVWDLDIPRLGAGGLQTLVLQVQRVPAKAEPAQQHEPQHQRCSSGRQPAERRQRPQD